MFQSVINQKNLSKIVLATITLFISFINTQAVSVCSTDDECNKPFGNCLNNTVCACYWGFYGKNCQQPWQFVFTVVTAGLGLIIIILIVSLICKCKQPSDAHPMQNGISNEGDVDLKNPFTDFQPGLMRARVPGNAGFGDQGLEMEQSATSRSPGEQSNGTYINIGFDSSNPKIGNGGQDHKRSSSTAARYF